MDDLEHIEAWGMDTELKEAANEHWRKVREQTNARHADLKSRGLNIFGDPLDTDYAYRRVTLDSFSDDAIAAEYRKRSARRRSRSMFGPRSWQPAGTGCDKIR